MVILLGALLLCLLGLTQGTSLFSPVLLISTSDQLAPVLNGYFLAFLLLGTWRYLRLIVHVAASFSFQPIIPKQDPMFRSRDCTVVVITIDGDTPMFTRCVESIIANNPFKVLIVTPFNNKSKIQAKFADNGMVTVLGAKHGNKRFQQVCGLSCVTTPMVVFADDDVIWPPTFLWTALAAFDNPAVGAAGTSQRLVRDHDPNMWEFFGAAYLERRNFECAATAHITGFVSTLSGRTQLIRTDIIKNPEFMEAYLSEMWLGCINLCNADDDKFITRWIKLRGWKMSYQYCNEVELRTTLHSNWRFFQNCIRWYRTIWRGAVVSIFVERSIWRGQPWMIYANLSRIVNPPALIMDSTLGWLLYNGVKLHSPTQTTLASALFCLWLAFTKTVKLIPHFWRYPADLKFLPLHFLFGYAHGFVKIYAFLSITSTSWLGRLTPEESGAMGLKAALPIGGIPDDIATPGVARLTMGGHYELPRCECGAQENGAWIKGRRKALVSRM